MVVVVSIVCGVVVVVVSADVWAGVVVVSVVAGMGVVVVIWVVAVVVSTEDTVVVSTSCSMTPTASSSGRTVTNTNVDVEHGFAAPSVAMTSTRKVVAGRRPPAGASTISVPSNVSSKYAATCDKVADVIRKVTSAFAPKSASLAAKLKICMSSAIDSLT